MSLCRTVTPNWRAFRQHSHFSKDQTVGDTHVKTVDIYRQSTHLQLAANINEPSFLSVERKCERSALRFLYSQTLS